MSDDLDGIPPAPPGSARERVGARRRSRRQTRADRVRRSRPLRVAVAVVAVVLVLAVAARPLRAVITSLVGESRGARSASDSAALVAHTGIGRTRSGSGKPAGGPGRATASGTAAAMASATAGPLGAQTGVPTAVRDAALPYPGPASVPAETITHGHPSGKLVAITIDDGIPFDTRLLDLLEQYHVRATTFLLGEFAASRPDLIRRLNKDGFEIANHSYNHPFLTQLSDAQVVDQIARTQKAISAITGNQAPYLRPPYGATGPRIKALAAKHGYRIVLWNRTFADTSRSATSGQLFKNVMNGLTPGDIILCHWGGKDTYEAMKLILPAMQQRGFRPVTLSEMLADSRRG